MSINETASGKKTARLKDVAKKAGVSETTTSMVFSGRGRISDETKRLVLDAAETLGYTHQKRNSRETIPKVHVALLIIIDREWSFLWHFLTEMISQIEQDLEQIGLKPVMIPVSIHEDDESIYRKITQIGCRAVYSIHLGKKELFKRLEGEDIPVIVIMNNNFQDDCFSICVDDFLGAFEGVSYLLKLGHKRINFVDDYREDLPTLSSDRYYGYRKALEEAGIFYSEEYKFSCTATTPENDSAHLNAMMNSDDPPTAFFCLDDEVAFRTWNALIHLGFKIPEDVSILCTGDVLDYSKPYIPPITTMHINMTDLGKLAVNMLNNRLKHNLDTIQVLKVKPQLFERMSCRSILK